MKEINLIVKLNDKPVKTITTIIGKEINANKEG
jgi:hypothetical protein